MTVQLIPSGAEALVQLCCDEFESAGASVSAVNGPNSWVAGSAAGLYQAQATVPFIATAYGQGVTQLTDADEATDLNSAGEAVLPWAAPMSSGPSFSFDPIGGDPSVVFSRFAGTASHTVSLYLSGAAGESCVVWVRKNTVDVLPGFAVVTFDPSGFGVASLVALDANCVEGDEYQVVGTAMVPPSSSVFVVADRSFWLAERLTAPVVDARLAVYDAADAFLYTADVDVLEWYRGAVRLSSLVMLPDSGRVKVLLAHSFGESDLEVSSSTHLELVYLGNPTTIAVCPEEPPG